MACTVIEYPQSMLNTGLFKPFSHVDFNQMRNLDNKSGKAAPDPDQVDGAVESLAKVIVKYQMHDLLGITLVHNHFSLAQGEVVATHVDPKNNLVIRSCMDGELEQKEQWPVFSLGVAKISDTNKQQIPYMWALDPAANTFFTMQFFDGSYTKIADRFEQLAQRENLAPFLEEFITEMKKLSMENDLGLFLHYQDLVPFDNNTEILFEITDKDTRQQVMFVTTKAQVTELLKKHGQERTTNTHWTVHHDAVKGTMWCCVSSCCTSH